MSGNVTRVDQEAEDRERIGREKQSISRGNKTEKYIMVYEQRERDNNRGQQ